MKLKQINNGQNLSILRGLPWALKLGIFARNCGEINREANHKSVKSGKVLEIFLRGRFLSIMNVLKGASGFAKEVISHSGADKKDGESLTSFS